MAQLVNKYLAMYLIEPSIKNFISVRECHFSCQLLAESSSPLRPVAYGERETLNLLHQTGTGVHVSKKYRSLKEKYSWVCLAVVFVLVGQHKA